MEYATLKRVDWFNHRRLLASIYNIPLAEAEERYCAMLDDKPMAALFDKLVTGNPGAVQPTAVSLVLARKRA